VASGDPTATGVVLWTRLAPRPDGTFSPSRWSWPSWISTRAPVAPGRATPGDGYAADRDRILEFLWKRQPANPVVLTGDIHAFFVNDLRRPGGGPDAPVVATELVGTSISSGSTKSTAFRKHLKDSPHVRFFENRLRGYTRCTVIHDRWYADLRVVDTIERREPRSAPWPRT
jgi:phosphodiesterase/alkaline phosphatase D-like protein